MHPSAELITQYKKRAEALEIDAVTFATKSDMLLGASPIHASSPMLAKAEQVVEGRQTPGYLVSSSINAAQDKIEKASAELRFHRDQYTTTNRQMRESNRQLTEILSQMRELKLDEIKFEEIKEILEKGIEALGLLKSQWDNLVRFFKMIANVIDCLMTEAMKGFLNYAKETRQQTIDAGQKLYGMEDFMQDLLYEQAFSAVKYAYLVHMLSDGYLEVSTNHVMPQLAHLDQLFRYIKPSDMICQSNSNR